MTQLQEMGFPQQRCIKALHATGNNDADTAMNWLFQHMEDSDIDAPLDLSVGGGGSGGASGSGGAIDPGQIAQIDSMGMGFTEAQIKKALKETGGDMERAVDWLFNHPDDMGLVDDEGGVGNTTGEISSSSKGEREMPGSTKLPANFLLHSIVCHKGTSTNAGYVLAFLTSPPPSFFFPFIFTKKDVDDANSFSCHLYRHYVAFIRKSMQDANGVDEEKWVLFNDEKVVEGADIEEMKKFAYVYMFQKV